MIEIIAAQRRIASSGEHLEHALLQPQDRDVERAAAKIVDSEDALRGLVEAIGECGCRRLIDQPQHLEPSKTGGILGGAAGRVVEIGGNGDDGPAHGTAQILLGPRLGSPQNIGGDFDGRQQAIADLQAHHAPARHDLEGQMTGKPRHILGTAAHETLDRGDDGARLIEGCSLRRRSYADRAIGAVMHDRGQESAAIAGSTQDFRPCLGGNGSHRVGGAEVDADGKLGFLGMRVRR